MFLIQVPNEAAFLQFVFNFSRAAVIYHDADQSDNWGNIRYEKPEDWSIVKVPLPKMRDNDVMVQVKACGVCGTGKSTCFWQTSC